MKSMMLLLAALLLSAVGLSAADTAVPPVPSPAQLSWQNAEVVALFHFDPRICHQDKPQLGNIHNVYLGEEKARAYAEPFNPEKLDMEQWIASAQAMGATAAVLVVKHEVGFCLWPSDANPYSLKMLKWGDGKRDLLREFVDSCRKHGLKPGVFTTTRFDNRLGVTNSLPMKQAKITREEYNRLQEAEVAELCSRYGDLFELWLDGSARTPAQGGPDLVPIFEKHQPKSAIFYHSDQRRDVRWGGNEEGVVGDPCWSTVKDPNKMNWGTGDPDGGFWCPAMADTPLCRDWFWRRDGNRGLKSLESLKNIYLNSVGRNATLVVGITPDASGLVPETDVQRCREFGGWLKATFGGESLAKTAGRGNVLTLELPAGATGALYVVLQEEIAQGERVRDYVLEREANGAWTELKKGTNIGHKRIIACKPGTGKLRLTITKATAEPVIANFSAYAAEPAAPATPAAFELKQPLRVLNYNVFEGFNRGQGLAATTAWIQETHPDILGLEELVGWNEEKLKQAAPAWGHPFATTLKNGGYNLGITSREPIEVVERHTQGFWHGYLHCRTAGVDVILAHLWPGTRRGQLREATQLRDLVARLNREGRQVILMGDFNAHSAKDQDWLEKQTELLAKWREAEAKKAPEDQFFKDGKYTYGIMDTVLAAPLRDLVREKFEAEHPEGGYAASTQALGSFPSRILPISKTPELQLPRLERIDFILATPGLARFCTAARVCRTPELLDTLSDHYPVLAEFRPKPDGVP